MDNKKKEKPNKINEKDNMVFNLVFVFHLIAAIIQPSLKGTKKKNPKGS